MRLRSFPGFLGGAAAVGLLFGVSAETGSGTRSYRSISGTSQNHGPVVLVYAKTVNYRLSAPSWIWRARADGSHPRRLLRGDEPLVSPDGRTIAFLRSRQTTHRGTTVSLHTLWLMRADGSHSRAILRTTRGFGPMAWAPDSRLLLVGDDHGLRLIDRARNSVSLLAGTQPSSTSAVDTATFSPDGRLVAYGRVDETGGDIFVTAVRGGSPRQLTHDHQSFEPLWGPSRIAYLRGRGFVDGDIWLMDGDGQGNTRLTHTAAGYYPAVWSADGRRLLGANPASHNGRLWAIDVPSGRARPLTKWIGDLFPQGLSRDGRLAYAAIGCGGRASRRGLLETIPFSGGRPTVIVRGPCRGSWSA